MKYLITYTVFSKDKEAVLKLMKRNYEIAKSKGAKFICVATEHCADCDISLVMPRGEMPYDMYNRIKLGLTGIRDSDEVYLVEDDIVYSSNHFNMKPKKGKVNYNIEVVYMNKNGFFDKFNRTGVCLHQAFADADTMRKAIDFKLKQLNDKTFNSFEPFEPDFPSFAFHEGVPSLDIRNGNNVSWGGGEDEKYFKDLKYWGKHSEVWQQWGFK